MSQVFLATLHPGIGRAADRGDLGWRVQVVAKRVDVRCLATDPVDNRVVFAGTQQDGVLRSHDGGLSWEAAGLGGLTVKSVAVSAVGVRRVYAGTRPARLFASDDGGRHWEELSGFRRIRSRWIWFSPTERPFLAYVQAIAPSPHNPAIIVAGIEAGAVVRSTDGGNSWQEHRPGAMRDCHSLVAHMHVAGQWYEGGWGGGAASADAGGRWFRPAGLDRRYGWAVAADATDSSLWYLSAAPGVRAHSDDADAAIYRSRAGRAWERLGGGLPDPLRAMPYALLCGETGGHLTAGLSSGEVWETRDAGETWARCGFAFPRIERSMIRLQLPSAAA